MLVQNVQELYKLGMRRAYFLNLKIDSIVMKKFLMVFVLIAGLYSCNSDDKAIVRFSLTDAPSLKGYQALYIDLKGVEYGVGDSTWVTLPVNPAIVNIMDLTNGQDTLLAEVELEAGQTVSQVRLLLGEDNTLVLADGSSVNIKVPSGQSSGLKFNVHTAAGMTGSYKVMIDFDAERSVVVKGNGNYSLKPVVRGYIVSNTSKIFGNISPSNIPFNVMAVMNGDTIMTVSDTAQNNYFMLHGLTSGTYEVLFKDSTAAIRKTLTQEVKGGTDVDLGTVQIN